MKQKMRLIDWAISFVAVIVVLGVMGSMDQADQEQSAKVLAEAKAQARAEHKAHQDRKYAELDAKARYMTSFDAIATK